jgi:hypothetical protein
VSSASLLEGVQFILSSWFLLGRLGLGFLLWKRLLQNVQNIGSQASLLKNKWDLVSLHVYSVQVGI